MQLLILPGASTCDNFGDLAMLQVALKRLKVLWPGAVFRVLTRDPVALRQHCPDVEPVPWQGRNRWLQCQALPGFFFPNIQAEIRRRFPISPTRSWRLALLLAPGQRRLVVQFVEALFNSDLAVLSGCGLLADPFAHNARQMLDTLAAAQRAGIPTALLSQGLGPMTDPALVRRAREVLPGVGRIFLRESRAGLPLLRTFAVPDARIATTGDDTVGMAFRERRSEPGSHIGVSLRLAAYAEMGDDTLVTVRSVLAAKALEQKARLLGLPITRQGEHSDVQALARLFRGLPAAAADAGNDLATPLHVIRRTADCRVVVAGSYHAGVFALAQGIPMIALAASVYYEDKFHGLADQFGAGCVVLNPGGPAFAGMLSAALDSLWTQSPTLRPQLLAAAERQVDAAHAAYAQLRTLTASAS